MSIARSLKKLFDKEQDREDQAQQEAWMRLEPDRDPGNAPPPPSLEVREEDRRFRCKVCGREEHNARYCPDCLSDTMVEIR